MSMILERQGITTGKNQKPGIGKVWGWGKHGDGDGESTGTGIPVPVTALIRTEHNASNKNKREHRVMQIITHIRLRAFRSASNEQLAFLQRRRETTDQRHGASVVGRLVRERDQNTTSYPQHPRRRLLRTSSSLRATSRRATDRSFLRHPRLLLVRAAVLQRRGVFRCHQVVSRRTHILLAAVTERALHQLT